MSILSVALGAKEATAYGLPGVGDLEVTGLSGRDKVYGSRIGRGEGAKTALETMKELERPLRASGYPARRQPRQQTDASLKERMPLLFAAQQIVHEDDPVLARCFGAQAVLAAPSLNRK